MTITYSRSKDQPGKVAYLLVVSRTGKLNISLSPFAPENLVSRDGFGKHIPRRLLISILKLNLVVVVVVYFTLTDSLRIQLWSQDRLNQTKSNRRTDISRESRQKRTDKKVASEGHRRDKIENTNKITDSRNKLEATA